jgi:hypothetical protein
MGVGEIGNTYKVLIGNPEQKRPFGIGEKIIYTLNFLVLIQLSSNALKTCGEMLTSLMDIGEWSA